MKPSVLDPAARDRILQQALLDMEKEFGKGTVLQLGSRSSVPVSVISTGSISLDAALGVGGVPRGRVVEIYGPESSGKTTLALHVIAQAQALGGVAAFIDAEHALDAIYAKKLGVDTDKLIVSQPDHGEQALEVAHSLISTNVIDVVVVDSVAALVPKAEIEGEMGDNFMGMHARLMSQAMRKLTGTLSRANACLIFINQIREKIGVVFGDDVLEIVRAAAADSSSAEFRNLDTGAAIGHVQVCGSDRGAVGDDHSDWPTLLSALDDAGYDGILGVESFTGENATIAVAASIWRPLAPSQDELAERSLNFLRSLLGS